jgi:PAS domain S-box-containing protein
MSASSVETGLARELDAPEQDQADTQPALPDRTRLFSLFGSWTFVASLAVGLATGLMLLPFAGDQFIGAAIAFGALCIAAAATYRALRASNRVEALEQKLLDETSYHAFVDGAIEGFFRTTREGRYLIANPALARIYGYDSPEQLHAEVTDIGGSLYVDPARREEFKALITANRMVRDFVSQIRRRDGMIIWIAENARAVLDGDDQFLYYEGTVEDITLQRESEEAMRRALLETQEATRAKAAFLAAMSHELKTPLNAVIGFSELMLHELFGPIGEERYKSYIGDIHDNGKHLLSLINDILDLSRIEGGLIDLDEQAVSLRDAAVEARTAVSGAKKNAAPIAIEIPADLPPVKADAKRLQHILFHLMSNAAKFTPPAGKIKVSAVKYADGGLLMEVADTGIGMAPDQIQHALEPFKQLDNRIERRFEGVGIGLPLASALCRLHGAKLTIKSERGCGTTVRIHFPAERVLLQASVA